MKKPATLREYRKLSRFTQDQLFARSGISQTRISRLEIGNVKPSPRERKVLAHALKIPAEILFPEV